MFPHLSFQIDFNCWCLYVFASGSSWGLAVMMPLAIPLGEYFDLPLMICVGAVISAGLLAITVTYF